MGFWFRGVREGLQGFLVFLWLGFCFFLEFRVSRFFGRGFVGNGLSRPARSRQSSRLVSSFAPLEPRESCVVPKMEQHPGLQRGQGFRVVLLDKHPNPGTGAEVPEMHEVLRDNRFA